MRSWETEQDQTALRAAAIVGDNRHLFIELVNQIA